MFVMNNKNQIIRLDDYLTEYVNYLKQKVPNKTGALSNSFEFGIEQTTNTYNIGIYALHYAKFNDAGVNGTEIDRGSIFSFADKMPPISSFESADNPWAVAKSIQKKGFSPSLFMSESFEDKVDGLATELMEGIWEDFVEEENNKK